MVKILFLLFFRFAEDPLERPTAEQGPTSKAVYRRQVTRDGPIYTRGIMMEGERIRLDTICQPATLHQILSHRGLDKQPHNQGLAAIIDMGMVGFEQTTEMVREREKEILEIAERLLG